MIHPINFQKDKPSAFCDSLIPRQKCLTRLASEPDQADQAYGSQLDPQAVRIFNGSEVDPLQGDSSLV